MKKTKTKFSHKISAMIHNVNDEPEKLQIFLYILSVINFIVSFILTIKQSDSLKEEKIDMYFNDFTETFLSNIFNKVFISLCIGVLFLYLLINLIQYFKSKKKSIVMNILLICIFVFLIIDSIIIAAIHLSGDNTIVFIAEKLIFNLKGDSGVLLALVYFAVTFIGILLFLGIFRGKKSVKSLVLCILNNTLVVSILAYLIVLLYIITRNIFVIIGGILILCVIPSLFYIFGGFLAEEIRLKNWFCKK